MPAPQRAYHRWGLADFFDCRKKSLLCKIAELRLTDVFYDLGCGDASILIYCTQKAHLAHAIGFENMPSRARRARLQIKEAGLEDVIRIEDDLYEADLSKADVIFDMMAEGRSDYAALYSERSRIKEGTRLIKHDLPLVGFLPDKIELPFYLMKFPLRRASTKHEWAQCVLMTPDATPDDLWRELYYFGYEKRYGMQEIVGFKAMLRTRVRQF